MKKSIFLFFAAILCAASMQAADWYVKGSFDNWGGGAKMSGTSAVVSCEIWLTGNNEYEFKMNNGNKWLGVDGTMQLTNNLSWLINGDKNAKIKTSVDGNYVFTWYISDKRLSVTYPDQAYYIAGTSAILEDEWSNNSSKNKMGKNGDEFVLIKYNRQLTKNGDYKYKMTSGTWDSSYPNSDAKIAVQNTGTYDIMFTYNPKTGELKHTLAQSVAMYCINTQEWDKVNIHNWLTTDFTTAWPGDGMTKTGDKWAGYDIYKKEISGLHKYCIFNNGSKQTSDLTIEGTYYDLGSGKWYNELPTPKFCLKGVFNSWNEDNTFIATTDPNLLTTTVTLSEGTHNFKVAICDLWLGNPGTMERHVKSVHEGGWEFKNKKDDGNDADECKIKADIAGEYIFTWNISSKKLTVTYPTPVFTSGDNSEIISALKNQNLDVKLDRSFKAGELHTLCVPFDIDASLIGTAYQLSNVKAQLSSMLKVETVECPTIEAGKPYLVVPTEDITGPILLKDVTIKDIDVAAVSNTVENNGIKVSLQGILNGGGQTDGTTEYWIGNGGYLYYDVTNKLGLRAMFTITGMPAGMRARVVTSENAATDVENITNSENTTIKVIKNGQLIIIRNGEKFNAQGVRF